MSSHEPVAIRTEWVGPALHGDTVVEGGGKTWNQIHDTVSICIFVYIIFIFMCVRYNVFVYLVVK